MTSDQHSEDEPLDIAPEGDTPEGPPPTARAVAEAALAVARAARGLEDAAGRTCGILRRAANTLEHYCSGLAGSAEEMEALADQLERTVDG